MQLLAQPHDHEVFNSYTMATRDLPDIYAQARVDYWTGTLHGLADIF